jgi:hypothetical protein
MDNHLWLWVVLAGLANYTAAHMVSQDGDDGPFEVFKRMRARAGETTWIGKGIHCFRCTSFWGAMISGLLLLGAVYGLLICQFLLIWGAVAAVAVFLWRYFG